MVSVPVEALPPSVTSTVDVKKVVRSAGFGVRTVRVALPPETDVRAEVKEQL